MIHQEHRETLHKLLQEELASTTALHACLQQERKALATMDSLQLEQLAHEKGALLKSLEQQTRCHGELAQAAGYGTSPEEIHAYIRAMDVQGNLLNDWQEQLQNLQACQHLNRVNGGVIELGRQQLHSIIGMLRGQGKTQDSTYKADGQKPANLGNRSLGSA